MVDMILFPSSFFGLSKVDEDLQQEYDAAKATGLFEVAQIFVSVSRGSGSLIY